MPKYWLMKSEPDAYGIDDLERDGSGEWDGVRNYQARNFMRDGMKVGDKVLFYHSNAKPPGVAGIAEVCRESYPDHTAWDPKSKYHDPKSSKDEPRWFMVDVKHVETFPDVVSLDTIRETPGLEDMLVIRRGMRLSIQPVEADEFAIIAKMGRGGRLRRQGGKKSIPA
ncbi:MAG: EVE domain-containing protein [Deltaproteobacteria bacterium]|jgi:predicted RNA-binding protein with PUA-like domain|nr:EVE domain-containing protein [Deltaproteobacteria bacterium]